MAACDIVYQPSIFLCYTRSVERVRGKWLAQDLPSGGLQCLVLQIPARGLSGAVAEKTLTSVQFHKIHIGDEASSQLSGS